MAINNARGEKWWNTGYHARNTSTFCFGTTLAPRSKVRHPRKPNTHRKGTFNFNGNFSPRASSSCESMEETYLLRALALMLLAANCARFLMALVGTTFKLLKLVSLRLCVELRHRRWLKLIGTDGGETCFKPNVTWSTDNCLRRIFLPSLTGLSFKSIDFCLRNKFLALLGWNCCRMVDISRFLLPFFSASSRIRRWQKWRERDKERKIERKLLRKMFKWIFSCFLLQSDSVLLMLSNFYELYANLLSLLFLFFSLYSPPKKNEAFCLPHTQIQLRFSRKKILRPPPRKITQRKIVFEVRHFNTERRSSTRAMPSHNWNIVCSPGREKIEGKKKLLHHSKLAQFCCCVLRGY